MRVNKFVNSIRHRSAKHYPAFGIMWLRAVNFMLWDCHQKQGNLKEYKDVVENPPKSFQEVVTSEYIWRTNPSSAIQGYCNSVLFRSNFTTMVCIRGWPRMSKTEYVCCNFPPPPNLFWMKVWICVIFLCHKSQYEGKMNSVPLIFGSECKFAIAGGVCPYLSAYKCTYCLFTLIIGGFIC